MGGDSPKGKKSGEIENDKIKKPLGGPPRGR